MISFSAMISRNKEPLRHWSSYSEKNGGQVLRELVQVYRSGDLKSCSKGVLNIIVENVAKAMELKGCSLVLLVLEGKILHAVSSYGLSDEYIQKGTVLAKQSIQSVLEGKPVAILDVAEDVSGKY